MDLAVTDCEALAVGDGQGGLGGSGVDIPEGGAGGQPKMPGSRSDSSSWMTLAVKQARGGCCREVTEETAEDAIGAADAFNAGNDFLADVTAFVEVHG